MSTPPPPPPRSSYRGVPASGEPPVAITNVELLEADDRRRHQQTRNPHMYYPQQPPPVGTGGGYVYNTGMPMYGLPSHAYYGSTPAGGMYHTSTPAPPIGGHFMNPNSSRRTRSTPLPTEAGLPYPSEYQPLMAPTPPAAMSYSGDPSLTAAAAQAMRMEATSSTGALTLDDIERSFNQVVSQQYTHHQQQPHSQPQSQTQQQQHHHHHHRSHSTSETLPSALSSAVPLRRSHRRAGSWGNPLPPPSPFSRSPNSATANRKRADSASGTSGPSRARTFSGSALAPRHRRSLSRQSSTEFSVASVASMMSVVSDISKSAFFGGVTDSGQVQMHYPTEHVRLIMQGSLPRGHVFCHPIDPLAYENYHLIAEEVQLLQWEHIEDDPFDSLPEGGRSRSGSSGAFNPHKSLQCRCRCNNCAGCTGKANLLPQHHFVINVPDDIYRRLLDEVVASSEMPCGLYFCGHHEDVSNPSIWIALSIVLTLFLLMGTAAYVTGS